MPGFRDKRVILLLALVFASALAIWAMGPNWGIDIKGGSRIMLRAEATHVTIKVSNYKAPDADNHVGDILANLRENLNASVAVLENYREDGRLKVEIGKKVDKDTIASLLKEGDNILDGSYNTDVKPRMREELINALRQRVDPSGTLGAQFKSVGKQYIRFEVPLGPEKAETLLGEVGRLEIFIGENLVLKGKHIRNVQSPRYSSRKSQYEVPFTLTDKGARKFANATENREGYPGVIYLDRPAGSILLYPEGFEETLKSDAELNPSQTGLTDADYRKEKHGFYLKTTESTDSRTGEDYPPRWFPVMVRAFKIKEEEVPDNTRNYLLNNLNSVTKVIYLGKRSELSDKLIQGDNFVVDNNRLTFENFQKKEELATKWLMRVVGIESFPTIMSGVAGSVKNAKDGLVITTGRSQSEAQNLRTILSQSLPLQVSIVSREELSPRLGNRALTEVFQAGLAALIAVGALVYYRYRKFKIVLPLILTMLCEVEITLGLSSIIPPRLLTLGLPEIGGLVAVVGTGVDHQIIITDEVLSGGISEGGHTPFSRRSDRAFSIIFAAAATTVAAMFALAFVGLGQMRGFAIITIIGVAISVLITRPAYARIIGNLLEREQNKSSGEK